MKNTMNLTPTEALDILKAAKPELERRYGVTRLALFGSMVRGETHAGSDVDVLVSFAGAADSRRYFGVQFDLEDAFQRPVDLVTDKALRPQLRPFIEREAQHV